MENLEIESVVGTGEASTELGKSKFDENQRQKFSFKSNKQPTFNPKAPPFEPLMRLSNDNILTIGPSKVVVNRNVWGLVAHNRTMPELPDGCYVQQPEQPLSYPIPSAAYYDPVIRPRYFEESYSRAQYSRAFGPVPHPDGVELRLRENITVIISLDRSIILNNPNSCVKIAVSSNMQASALEHPNGKIYQQLDRVDIMTYDGTKKLNNYVRYAKMWEKGISLTADGCALIYLVDSAGTRTTSDAVNKDHLNEYCWQVFVNSGRLGSHSYADVEIATKNYHLFTQDDGTQVFDILGIRVAQTVDGMVRICRSQNRLKIHTSPTNGSATLTTPFIHCTASMGTSSHLFVRRDERRMHFDGASFVVRNAGHSAGFDEHNNLRVY